MSDWIQRKLIEEGMRRREPITVILELLPVCNLNCKMCYIRMDMQQAKEKGGLRTKEEWLTLARELREAGTLFLLLTGGEVFLYPEFRELYEELYRMGFIITINTNATLLDEDTVMWLKKFPPKCVSISLYGASDETYEAQCGQKGMFTKVDRAVRLLLLNRVKIEFKTVVTPLNRQDMIACCAYAQQMGVFYKTDMYAFPPSRKFGNVEQIRFTPEEAVECRFERNRTISDKETFVKNVVEHLYKYEMTKDKPGEDLYGFTCGAANCSCWITWQGRMTPCALLEEPCTSPFEQGFLPAWNKLKETCDQILMSSECSHCDKRSVCTTCPAANLTESGSFQKKAEYKCRMTEKTLEDMYHMVNEWGIDIHQYMREKGVRP